MTVITHGKYPQHHISASEVFLAFLVGVAAVAAIWLFTGLMIGLLFI